MKANYHTHTKYCKHAQGNVEDFVKEGIRHKMDILGISDHAPYPDDRYGMRMEFSQLQEYIDEVKECAIKYDDQITIILGLEIEYNVNDHDYYDELLETYEIEYLILGQHVYVENNIAHNIYMIENGQDTTAYLSYAKSIQDAIKSGYFQIVAHPDVVFINNLAWDENCERACDMILSTAAQHQMILELNANGFRRGKYAYVDGERYPYPHPRFWEKVSSYEIPVIIGSDAHSSKDLYDTWIEEAKAFAKQYHLSIIDTIKESKSLK